MGDQKPKPLKPEPAYLKFVFGGAAGSLGQTIVYPLDLIKNRMQLSAKSEKMTMLQVIKRLIKNEGPLAFYDGLSAAILRQCTYTTSRLGVYTSLFQYMSDASGKPPNFAVKAGIGMLSGAIGAFVGTPADVSMIRMSADGKLPPSERRNYKHVFDAMFRMVREEGILCLWRGAIPTIGRAMVVNAVQLATYSQSKEMLLKTGFFKENINLFFWASMVSGLMTTVASMPMDIAKTKIQQMKTVEGQPEFTGTLDVLFKTARNEGVLALWKGFVPYYARLGPLTVLIFVFLEQFKAAYQKYA